MASDWTTILQSVNALATQVEQAGLLQGAIAAGFLERCRTPATVADLARITGLGSSVVQELCTTLRSAGALAIDEDGQVVVSDAYAPLLDDGLGQRAVDRLAASSVRSSTFRDLFNGDTQSYWDMSSTDRIALAANATGDPETEFGRQRLVAVVHADAEWDEAFTVGGRFLDLGCGVAGAIASFLDHYPRLTAVGIDSAADVLEVAQARARNLGVADRATFVVADAGSFRDPDPFDVVFWPQTFYPEASRTAALTTIMANLRPGGLLVTVYTPPRPPRPDAGELADLGAGRGFETLMRRLWGIADHSAQAMQAELEEAGFVDVMVGGTAPPNLPMIKAHRPG